MKRKKKPEILMIPPNTDGETDSEHSTKSRSCIIISILFCATLKLIVLVSTIQQLVRVFSVSVVAM